MSAHTPGPWRVDRSGALLGVNVVAPTDWICKVGLSDRPNVMEDARLIAAAPELLEAMESALPHVENDALEQGVNPDEDAVVIQARAAIAKARGRA